MSRYTQGGTPKYSIAKSTGDNQIVVVSSYTAPIVGLVKDASGNNSGNITVNFSISTFPAGATGQELTALSTNTNSNGFAETKLKLGNIPAEYGVTATCASCEVSASSVLFRACGKLQDDGYHQDQAPWDDDILDHHSQGKTIGKRGCALTAMTMLINAYQRRYGLGYAPTDPGALNAYLIDPAHYGFKGDADLDWSEVLFHYTQEAISYQSRISVDQDASRYEASVRSALAKVDASLLRGEPAVLHLQSTTNAGHFVMAVGRCGGNYLVADPNSATALKVLDPLARKIRGVRLFKLKVR